jgi:hypothetical protein
MDDERYIGQRGPDKEQREFNPKSLLNLKQFQKPAMATNSDVNPVANLYINWLKIGIIIVIIIAVGLIIWKILDRSNTGPNSFSDV